MASKRKDSVIGFDPLAWMKGGDEPVATTAAAPAPAAPAAAPMAAAPVVAAPPAAAAPAPVRDNHTITFEDTLTIEQVAGVHADLAGRLGEKQLLLDASALTRVDTAGLQLLAAFIRTAESRGARIEWRAPQAALRESARRIGLEGALRL